MTNEIYIPLQLILPDLASSLLTHTPPSQPLLIIIIYRAPYQGTCGSIKTVDLSFEAL